MAKQEKSGQSLNQIKTSTNVIFNVIFLVLAVMCIIPLLFVFSISITDEESIRANGYQLINRADVGGKYQGTWQTAQATWVTIIRKLTNTVVPTLPKTGY